VKSITNIGLILTNSLSGIISYKINQQLTSISVAWCKLNTIFGQMFGLCSVYTICFSTFHRYSLRQMGTLKLAYRLTIFNICFIFLHSLFFLIFNQIQSTFACTVYNVIVKRYLSFFLISNFEYWSPHDHYCNVECISLSECSSYCTMTNTN
jgi:hypothetical protein